MTNTSEFNHFSATIVIYSPWTIDKKELFPSQKKAWRLELHIYVSFLKSSRFPCSICSEEHTSYDTRESLETSQLLPIQMLHSCLRSKDTMLKAWSKDCWCTLGKIRLWFYAYDGRRNTISFEAPCSENCSGRNRWSWHKIMTYTQLLCYRKESQSKGLDIQNGKGNDTVTSFGEVFCAHNGNKDAVTDITSDMCHG